MPAQYEIHTSTTKSILLIEYSVEQLAGHCVIMRDITLMQHRLNWQNLQQRRNIITIQSPLQLYVLQVPPYYILSHCNTRANHQYLCIHPSSRTNVYS